MATFLKYIPPFATTAADEINIGGAPFILRTFSGLGNARFVQQSQKGPFQFGETFINTDVSARILSITIRVQGTSYTDLLTQKNKLAKAMVLEPDREKIPEIGILQFFREGLSTLELEVVPRLSPQFTEIRGAEKKIADADLEFYAPNPHWRETADKTDQIQREEFNSVQLTEVTVNDYNSTGTNTNLNVIGTNAFVGGRLEISGTNTSGNRTTPNKATTNAEVISPILNDSIIWWDDVIRPNTSITIEKSFDDGGTWETVTRKGEAVKPVGTDMTGINLKLRATLNRNAGSDPSPILYNLYWRCLYDFPGGGFILPSIFPGEIVSFDVRDEVNNTGDVSVPILATITVGSGGQVKNPRIVNETIDKEIKVDITVTENQALEIDTTFGKKSVTLIDSLGNRTNAMQFLDLDVSEFWKLKSGTNRIFFDATQNTKGTLEIIWRNRFAGV